MYHIDWNALCFYVLLTTNTTDSFDNLVLCMFAEKKEFFFPSILYWLKTSLDRFTVFTRMILWHK